MFWVIMQRVVVNFLPTFRANLSGPISGSFIPSGPYPIKTKFFPHLYVGSETDGRTDVPYSQVVLGIVNSWNYVALPESQSGSLQDVSSLMLVIIRFTTAFQLPHSSYLLDSMIYGTPSFSLPLLRLVTGLH
jgi:hypothetical protein